MTEHWKPVTTGVKLSQAAPIMPLTEEFEKMELQGVKEPISSATIPSVYNKKLSKLFRGRLVVLSGEFTVAQALQRMAKYNISSVPVLKSKTDKTVLGFVDTLDFLAHLCNLVEKERKESQESGKEASQEKTEKEFKNTPISQIVDLSGKNPFHVLHGDESLANAVEYYLKGVHRIAISDHSGDIIGVISQWTIVNYLATVPTEDKEWIPSLREPVSKSCFSSEVISVNSNENTLDSFMKMHSQNVSALAVLDEDGKLCGNLSASDLKGFHLYLRHFSDLQQPLSQFLATIRKMQGRPGNFVVTVTPDTPVLDLLMKLNEEIIHRVFIVDDNFKLIGVYSLTNLLQKLVVDTHTISTFAKKTAPTFLASSQ